MIKQVVYSIFILFFASQCLASDAPFTVEGINVYAESVNLDDATYKAADKGMQDAYEILLKRLMPSTMVWKIDTIEKHNLSDLIEEKIVSKERMTSNTYSAQITYVFDDNKVKSILNKTGVNYAEEYSPKRLIIPILMKGDEKFLWEQNDWMKAWSTMPDRIGLSRFVFALGDLEDITFSNIDSYSGFEYEDFNFLLKKYGADEVIVIHAKLQDDNFIINLEIVSEDMKERFNDNMGVQHLGDEFSLYKKLAESLLIKIDDSYKGFGTFDSILQFKTSLKVNIKSAKEWNRIHKKLLSVGNITSIEIGTITSNEVQLDIFYKIDPSDMTRELAQNKLQIYETNDQQYLRLLKN